MLPCVLMKKPRCYLPPSASPCLFSLVGSKACLWRTPLPVRLSLPASMSSYLLVSLCVNLPVCHCPARCLSSLCMICIPCVSLCRSSFSSSLTASPSLSCLSACWCRLYLTTSILLDVSAARCLIHVGPQVCFSTSLPFSLLQKLVIHSATFAL